MNRSGAADLVLMGGSIPSWLFDRMTRLSLPIVESIILEYGQEGFLKRLTVRPHASQTPPVLPLPTEARVQSHSPYLCECMTK
jgi:hypothetical protein